MPPENQNPIPRVGIENGNAGDNFAAPAALRQRVPFACDWGVAAQIGAECSMSLVYELIRRVGMKSTSALLLAAIVLAPNLAEAAYTRATSGPVSVTQIYTNEYGSPFVWFSSVVNSACAGGGEAL